MTDLRQRQAQARLNPSSTDIPKTETATGSQPNSNGQARKTRASNNEGVSILDIIRILVTLAIASCGLSYYVTNSESLIWGYQPWFTRWPVLVRYVRGPLNLTPTQLALYNGTDPSLPILLAVNGTIFDVSANPLTYGPNGGYSFFTGKDATRAFVTGCFQDDLTDDLTGVEEMYIPIDDDDDEAGGEVEGMRRLTSGEKKIRREQETRQAKALVRKQVEHWENFFRNHKKYFEVGKVVKVDEGKEDGKVKGKKRELCQAAVKNRPKRGGKGQEVQTGKIGKPRN